MPWAVLTFSPSVPWLGRELDVPFVYYAVDSAWDRSREEETLGAADMVVAATRELESRFRGRCRRLEFLPHGVPESFLQGDSEPNRPESDQIVAGFVGSVNGHLDIGLIEALARRNPDISFVFVGPFESGDFGGGLPEVDRETLQGLHNVTLAGPVPSQALPERIDRFDVGIVPYDTTHFRVHFSHHKALQYLARGKAVVTTCSVPGDDAVPDVVGAATVAEFENAIRAYSARRNRSDALKRIGFARRNTWRGRADTILAWMNEIARERPVLTGYPGRRVETVR